jgi:hypothetical protein
MENSFAGMMRLSGGCGVDSKGTNQRDKSCDTDLTHFHICLSRLTKLMPASEILAAIKAAYTILEQPTCDVMMEDPMEDDVPENEMPPYRHESQAHVDTPRGAAAAMLDAARQIRAGQCGDGLLTACRAALLAAETDLYQKTSGLEQRRAAAAAAASKRLANEPVRYFFFPHYCHFEECRPL